MFTVNFCVFIWVGHYQMENSCLRKTNRLALFAVLLLATPDLVVLVSHDDDVSIPAPQSTYIFISRLPNQQGATFMTIRRRNLTGTPSQRVIIMLINVLDYVDQICSTCGWRQSAAGWILCPPPCSLRPRVVWLVTPRETVLPHTGDNNLSLLDTFITCHHQV